MHSVLLATCAALPEGDEDAAALVEALAEDNVDGRWAVWNDPDVDWDRAPTVLRSTWDYPQHRAQFLEWIAAVPVLFRSMMRRPRGLAVMVASNPRRRISCPSGPRFQSGCCRGIRLPVDEPRRSPSLP